MNLRKLIKEELDDFEWIGDMSFPKVGDRYVFGAPGVNPQTLTNGAGRDKFTVKDIDEEYVTILWDDNASQADWTQRKKLDKFLVWISDGETYIPINESDDTEWIKDTEPSRREKQDFSRSNILTTKDTTIMFGNDVKVGDKFLPPNSANVWEIVSIDKKYERKGRPIEDFLVRMETEDGKKKHAWWERPKKEPTSGAGTFPRRHRRWRKVIEPINETSDFEWMDDTSVLGDGSWIVHLNGANPDGCFKEVQEWLFSQGRQWTGGSTVTHCPENYVSIGDWEALSGGDMGEDTTSFGYWHDDGWGEHRYDVELSWSAIMKTNVNEQDDFDWMETDSIDIGGHGVPKGSARLGDILKTKMGYTFTLEEISGGVDDRWVWGRDLPSPYVSRNEKNWHNPLHLIKVNNLTEENDWIEDITPVKRTWEELVVGDTIKYQPKHFTEPKYYTYHGVQDDRLRFREYEHKKGILMNRISYNNLVRDGYITT
jgi:hypothetical protein